MPPPKVDPTGPNGSVGAVVVAHARADLALRCVSSLAMELDPASIVVVVNVPSRADPGDLELLRRSSTVVSPPAPQGFGANLNLGAAHLEGRATMLLLLNDDVEVGEGTLRRLVETLESDARIGIVGPAVSQTVGKQPPLRPQFPTVLGACLRVTALPLGRLWNVFARRAELGPGHDPERDGWVLGAAMLVRAQAFRDVDGFDPEFFLYYEETDFCYRVRAAGWKIAWREDAPVLHRHGASTGAVDATTLFFESERLYYRKRLGPLRFGLLELSLSTIFLADCMYHAVMTALRPGTASRRMKQLHDIWARRIFLRRPSSATAR